MSEILETESIPCSFTAILEVALYYPELKQQLFYHLPICLPADVSSYSGRLLEDQLEILNFLLEDQLKKYYTKWQPFFHIVVKGLQFVLSSIIQYSVKHQNILSIYANCMLGML